MLCILNIVTGCCYEYLFVDALILEFVSHLWIDGSQRMNRQLDAIWGDEVEAVGTTPPAVRRQYQENESPKGGFKEVGSARMWFYR